MEAVVDAAHKFINAILDNKERNKKAPLIVTKIQLHNTIDYCIDILAKQNKVSVGNSLNDIYVQKNK